MFSYVHVFSQDVPMVVRFKRPFINLSVAFPMMFPLKALFSPYFPNSKLPFLDGVPSIFPSLPWISHGFPYLLPRISHHLRGFAMDFPRPQGAAPRSPSRCRRPARHRPGPWGVALSAATRRPGDVHLRFWVYWHQGGY